MSLQDIIVGARRKLLADAGFQALLGVDVGRDPIGKAFNDGWVFKGSDNDHTPDRNPRNTGLSTITLSANTSWTNPNRHNSLRFPELYFSVLSDSTRGPDPSLLLQKDAEYRCDRVGSVIERVFNDLSARDHIWPNGLYVVSCVLWTDFKMNYVPDTDGLVHGDISFALEIG